MKLAKFASFIVILATAYAVITVAMPPHVTVDSLDSQKLYGDSITFRITVRNYAPVEKKLFFPSSDTGVVLLVDKAPTPSATPENKAEQTITMAPFSTLSATRTVSLTQADADTAASQRLGTTENVMRITPGQHSVRASWAGATSDVYTFGVR